MSTYTVTDTPSQVLLGSQGVVSLVNKGPSTIYLEADTAVSVLNGMALPPTGQMTWNTDRPLWAVCQSGNSAVLLVNPAAGRIDASRAKFWSLLQSYTNPDVGAGVGSTPDPISAECGHCETILLKLAVRGQQTTNPPTTFLLEVNWYDDLNNIMAIDDIWVNALSSLDLGNIVGTLFVQIPVIGSVFSVSFTQMLGDNTAHINVAEIFGTDRSLPYKDYSTWEPQSSLDSRIILGNCLELAGGAFTTGDGLVYNNLSVNLPDHIYLASLGNTLILESQISSPTGTAGSARYEVRDVNGNVFGQQFIDHLGSGIVIVTQSVIPIPNKSAMQIASAGALNGTSVDFGITWQD